MSSLLEKLFGQKRFSAFFTNDDLYEAGLCPNCWGEQEYDNQFRDLVKDKQIDINNKNSRHAFIQDFVVNQVDGIHLKKGDQSVVCERCNTVFQ